MKPGWRSAALVIVFIAHALLLWALMALTMLKEVTPGQVRQPEARPVMVNIAPPPMTTAAALSTDALPAPMNTPSAPQKKPVPRAAATVGATNATVADNPPAPSGEPVVAVSPGVQESAAPPALAVTTPPPTVIATRAAHSQCALAPYPPALKEQGIEGVVHLRILVDREGRAADVQMVASSGWRLFDVAALTQARGCRFVPARLGAQPVDDWVEFPMRFALNG